MIKTLKGFERIIKKVAKKYNVTDFHVHFLENGNPEVIFKFSDGNDDVAHEFIDPEELNKYCVEEEVDDVLFEVYSLRAENIISKLQEYVRDKENYLEKMFDIKLLESIEKQINAFIEADKKISK